MRLPSYNTDPSLLLILFDTFQTINHYSYLTHAL